MPGDGPAALPDRQIAATSVVFARHAHGDAVDRDEKVFPADPLTGKRQNPLHQRHAARDVAAILKKTRDRLGRCDHCKIGDLDSVRQLHKIYPDRHAGAGVPDEFF